MEQKLVELAKSLLKKGPFTPFIKNQIHRTNESRDRSGMICSGEQTVGFYFLDESNIPFLEKLSTQFAPDESLVLSLNEKGIELVGEKIAVPYLWKYANEKSWQLLERVNYKPRIYIIGAGHVGLAFSKLMHQLGFYITLLDDRANLNTLEQNTFADEKKIVDYREVEKYIENDQHAFVALMSFGYKVDKQIIKKLLHRSFKYFGVLGSKAKMAKLFEELMEEGYPKEQLDKIYSPIGLEIHSKTPMEIAISIAAEIIAIKNKP